MLLILLVISLCLRLLCRSPPFHPGQFARDQKNQSESLKTVSFIVQVHLPIKGGQHDKDGELKSGEWCGQARRVMTVIYRFSFLHSVHFSAVIQFTFNGSGSLISPCEELR